MISPEQIKQKAQRQYENFLRAAVTGECFFPIDLPIGSTPKNYPDLRKAVTELIDASKEKKGFGYTLVLETKNTRKHGPQSLPQKIYIENKADYLALIEKAQAFADFQSDIALIQSTVPALSSWTKRYPLKVIAHHGHWPNLLKVCQYFQENPKPNLYIRELPIAVHTKFVEEHKGILRSLLETLLPEETLNDVESDRHAFEKRFSLRYDEPLIRMRILDPSLQQQYGFPISDFSLAVSDFARLQLGSPRCFITENMMPFLTMPTLADGIAVLGAGRAVSLLKSVSWLAACSIFYWGDLDAAGFEMLSQMRSYFSQTKSILMDEKTYQTFRDFEVDNEQATVVMLTNLQAEEQTLYKKLAKNKRRLEQERIRQNYVNQVLAQL